MEDVRNLNVGDWWEDESGNYAYIVASVAGIDGKVIVIGDFSDVPTDMLKHIVSEREDD